MKADVRTDFLKKVQEIRNTEEFKVFKQLRSTNIVFNCFEFNFNNYKNAFDTHLVKNVDNTFNSGNDYMWSVIEEISQLAINTIVGIETYSSQLRNYVKRNYSKEGKFYKEYQKKKDETFPSWPTAVILKAFRNYLLHEELFQDQITYSLTNKTSSYKISLEKIFQSEHVNSEVQDILRKVSKDKKYLCLNKLFREYEVKFQEFKQWYLIKERSYHKTDMNYFLTKATPLIKQAEELSLTHALPFSKKIIEVERKLVGWNSA